MHEKNIDKIADAVARHWTEQLIPVAALPFAQLARLDRPIGWWLLLLPCLWSSSLAVIATGGDVIKFLHIFLFFVGAVSMRGAGCAYNDIVDREIDARVARTKFRPLPSGRITPKQAGLFTAVLCLIGFCVLLQFNRITIVTGFASLPFVVLYPFMKRITNWPQVCLGIGYGWGALMGWAAIFGELSAAPMALFAGAVLWVVGYDTIYAHQDKEDDELVGVKSTTHVFGDNTKHWLVGIYGSALALFATSYCIAGAGLVSFSGLALGAGHMIYQIIRLDIKNPNQCLKLFRSNRDFGLIIFYGLTLDMMI